MPFLLPNQQQQSTEGTTIPGTKLPKSEKLKQNAESAFL